ncbi:MAG TPA: 16S rRNA (cytidine(1402)-2'-O)-methyltransferase [Candidatus Dojkabacteria bacterium]|nr:16S rRNA (cytidine(1402)-2'-O)-methyltransferase [Candidatus Dojkabacteria bacterium]HQI92499.1 16S rRNA (cytidine(1402)-2'-O)-methyltransferase [Candidatus Dojkabacteria bacterium]
MNKGKLYVVATPIGNLEDITFRAIDTLKKVTFVLAEDTRESYKLFNRYDIKTQLISYRDQNHEKMLGKILEKLDMGLDLALISDCGTPLISDPGFKLIRELRERKYDVVSIPGPSALTSALSISGLVTDRFAFLGFLPKSDIKRKKLLQEYVNIEGSLIFYESPKRLIKLLDMLKNVFGEKKVGIAKDISKMREMFFYGNISEVSKEIETDDFKENPHGEYVVILENK